MRVTEIIPTGTATVPQRFGVSWRRFGLFGPRLFFGSLLALKSGVMLADEVDEALKNNQPLNASCFDNYGKRCNPHRNHAKNRLCVLR